MFTNRTMRRAVRLTLSRPERIIANKAGFAGFLLLLWGATSQAQQIEAPRPAF